MLVDPPLRYHLPQEGWIRLNEAIELVPDIRREFIDCIDYFAKDIGDNFEALDIDWIDVSKDRNLLNLDISGAKALPRPHSSIGISEELYRDLSLCIEKAQKMAREALYVLIIVDRIPIYARKHEHDADLQLVPPYVWEMTSQRRDMASASAMLPSGKHYYDIHLDLGVARPCTRQDGLGPSHGAFVDWFVEQMLASPTRRAIKISEDGGQLYDKAQQLKVPKSKVKELKDVAFARVPREVAEIWRRPGPQYEFPVIPWWGFEKDFQGFLH